MVLLSAQQGIQVCEGGCFGVYNPLEGQRLAEGTELRGFMLQHACSWRQAIEMASRVPNRQIKSVFLRCHS